MTLEVAQQTTIIISEKFEPSRCYGDIDGEVSRELRPGDFKSKKQMGGIIESAFARGQRVFATKAGGLMFYVPDVSSKASVSQKLIKGETSF